MTGNTQLTSDQARTGQMKLCDNSESITLQTAKHENPNNDPDGTKSSESQDIDQNNSSKSEQYWQMQYESLKRDYDHLQKLNQNLEEKLLNVVEATELEKSTLMADVNKLSTKLVDARMKLHDREEKDVLHAAECNAPCHSKSASSQVIPIMQTNQRASPRQKIDNQQRQQMMDDPNLV